MTERYVAAGAAATFAFALVVMAALPFMLDRRGQEWLYASEHSVVEQASMYLWLALGVSLLVILRPLTVNVVAAVGACFAFGAREGDLHKAFTDYSVLRIGFYFRDAAPLLDRAVAGVIVLLAATCIVLTTIAVCRHAMATGGLRTSWARVVLLTVVLGGLSKLFDRGAALLDGIGVRLLTSVDLVMQSLEEGIELLLPLLFLLAAIMFARRRALTRALDRSRSDGRPLSTPASRTQNPARG